MKNYIELSYQSDQICIITVFMSRNYHLVIIIFIAFLFRPVITVSFFMSCSIWWTSVLKLLFCSFCVSIGLQ